MGLSLSGPTAGELRGRAKKRDLDLWEQNMREFGNYQREHNPNELATPHAGGYLAPTEKQMLRMERIREGEKEVARQKAEQDSKLGRIRKVQAKARSEMTKLKWQNK
jgi:hypothetical protein